LPWHGNRHCDGRHKRVDLVNLAVDFAAAELYLPFFR